MSDTDRPKWKNVLSLGLGFVECLCFAMIYFGWPNLVYIYKEEGVFADLCDNNITSDVINASVNHTSPAACTAADSMFNLCFNIALAASLGSTFISGMIFDRYGLWVSRGIVTLLFVSGVLMMAFTGQKSLGYLVFPGFSFIGIAGCTLGVISPHIAMQAGEYKSTVTALYSGTMDSGVVIFLVVKLIYEQFDIHYKYSLCVLAGSWIIGILHTIFILPKYKLEVVDTMVIQHIVLPDGGDTIKEDFLAKKQLQYTFKDCLKSPLYWLMNYWSMVLNLKLGVFVGSLNLWLEFNLDYTEVSHFVSVFGYISLAGLLVSPWVGLITDKVEEMRHGQTVDDVWLTNAKAAAPSLWIGTSIAVLHSAVVIFFSPTLVYVSFVLLLFFRAFLFGNLYTFVPLVFPSHLLGKCIGFMFMCSGIVTWLQFALFKWAESEQDFTRVNGVVLLMTITTFILPFYIEVNYILKGRTSGTSKCTVTTRL